MRRVALIIAKRDGLVLFGKRRDTGKYTLPGGHLNEGEEPIDGARRELKEETGLTPKTQLKLVDERTLREVQFYTFECEVDGVPNGKDDPDQECGVWGFFDIDNGVPKDMASNMAGPKEREKNIVLDTYGLAKSISHDDEVDRLLAHPNPIERRMALKTNGVQEKHLVRALGDEDRQVQTQAMQHPTFGRNALMALMQMPNREHLQLVGLGHPSTGRDHLEALYHTHKDRPMSEKVRVLKAISHHGKLDGGLIEKMVNDGNGGLAIDNLHTPPHVIRQIIEDHVLDPTHVGKKALARRALKHPMAPLDLVDEAFEHGPADVKIAVAMGPHLNEAKAQDVLMRGQLPANDHEAALRGAIIGNPNASKRHLETATKDRNAIVRAHAQKLLGQGAAFKSDMSKWLGEQLQKATRPEDYKAIVSAVKNGGHHLVDAKREAGEHPASHNHDVEVYKQTVLDSPQPFKRLTTIANKPGSSNGITRKLIYQVPKQHPTHGGAKYMVKPYHERPVTRLKTWAKTPHQGWAEMTNQSLYHAGGIGHLHQRVHVAEHNMGEGHEAEPALVVRMDQGMQPIADYKYGSTYLSPEMKHDARKVAMMDFLSNNLDRHGGNIMVGGFHPHPEEAVAASGVEVPSRLLAIDHSRSFQYQTGHDNKWQARKNQPRELEDRFDNYVSRATPLGDPNRADIPKRKPAIAYMAPMKETFPSKNPHQWVDDWTPAFDWWGEQGGNIRQAMNKRLELIKDPEVRAHIKRNFDARADYLDERSNIGIENFGDDWGSNTVPLYRPGELTDEEKRHRDWTGLHEANV